MGGFSFSLDPLEQWDQHCSRYNALFHSSAWQALLEKAFSCQTVYGWNPDTNCGITITNFKAGPFRIGYLGFPVGGLIGAGTLDRDTVTAWKKQQIPLGPHCLRIPVSAFSDAAELQLPYLENPETAIVNLQDWSLDSVSKKLRRDVRKACRSELTVSDATHPSQVREIYHMYHDTVKRNSGSLRYNEAYFSGLITLAQSHPGIRCMLAWLGTDVAGFLIVGRHGRTAYYLHGGTNIALKRHSPSDLLLHDAITWARQERSECFNLMTSSADQSSLIRYKEKWGAITRPHKTYILSLRPSLCLPFRVMERLYGIIR